MQLDYQKLKVKIFCGAQDTLFQIMKTKDIEGFKWFNINQSKQNKKIKISVQVRYSTQKPMQEKFRLAESCWKVGKPKS